MDKLITRRELLHNGLAFISLGLAMPTFLMRAAHAADPTGLSTLPAIPSGKILVVIELSGGNDGLNTVIPWTDPAYAKLRPTIGIRKSDVVQIGANLGLHPSLKPVKSLYDQGHLAVVTGVGYPNPNRSHFHSMDIWQTADPEIDIQERTGWIARYFDNDGHFKGNPLSGVTLGSSLPLALFTEDSPASAIGNGEDYQFQTSDDRAKHLAALRALYSSGTVAGSQAEFIRNVGSNAYSSTTELQQALRANDEKAADAAKYPQYNSLGDGLRTVAKLVTGGLETRVYYVGFGGFDTHANQPYTHAHLLEQFAEALTAFYNDLEMQGRANDVTVMTFSEFGRRAKENSSAGTDHGAASIMMVAGGAVKGAVYGDYPSLTDLDDGDLRFHTDFRSVYATVLDNWVGSNSQAVLGGTFPKLGFV